MPAIIKRWLAHPLTRDLDIDDPRTTVLRRQIVEQKRGLRSIYEEWYALMAPHVPAGDGVVLELGSGAGFLADHVPGVITSDVFFVPGERVVADARVLPFRDGTLRSIVMVDVFHHIPEVSRFLGEAVRCLRPGGTVVMIEPWVTPLSRLIYRYLHHEPFAPGAADWSFPATGPLSGANGALPWIVFERDVARFTASFASLRIRVVRPTTMLTYLLSGGVSLRTLVPDFAWPGVQLVERLLGPFAKQMAMFALIVLERERT